MIVIDKPKLKFLLAGRAIEVPVAREYRKGRVYAVGVKPKHTICRVLVVDSATTGDSWTLTIRQHAEEQPLFLAANPGGIRSDYTTNPHRAARGEPEVIDPGVQAKFSRDSAERDDLLRRERAHQQRISRLRRQ